MSLARQRWRTFSRGWWPAGSPDEMPPGTLRRGVGINAIKTPPLQSRWGATQLYALNAHSLYRFADVRYQGVGPDLLKDGVVIAGSLSGARLTFTRMPPFPGSVDYMFVAGGGRLLKVSPSGVVSNWGIAPPPIDFTTELVAAPPDGMTVTPGIGGPLTGSYTYLVSFVITNGSESAGNPTPVVAAPVAQQDDVALIPVGPTGTTQRKLWRTIADGLTPLYRLVTINDNVTAVFADVTPDASLFAAEVYGVLNGTYKYAVTFRNSITGSRSDPNPATFTSPITAQPVNQPVNLQNLPVSVDPQVDQLEIWRTAANLDVLFKLTTVPIGTTFYVDRLPDSALQDEVLPIDNAIPDANFNDVVAPYVGRMWWARNSTPGQEGRVFFSPVGRPESLGGFIEINNGDDPTQKLIFWGGALYCWTNGKIIQILGSDEPFTFNEVFAAPGTVAPFSVVATPYGVLYQAVDGVRLFDGAKSTIVGYDAAARLFQGVAQDAVPAFTAVLGAYNRREVWFSDTTQGVTIVVDPTDGTLRVARSDVTALYYEPDTEDFIGSFAGLICVMEPPGVLTDAGLAIAFEIETPGFLTDAAQRGLVQRIYLDVDTAGQLVLPTLVLDEVEVPLPGFITSGRPTEPPEITVGRWGRVASVRLSATLTDQVTIYGIEADIYIPAPVAPQGEVVSA